MSPINHKKMTMAMQYPCQILVLILIFGSLSDNGICFTLKPSMTAHKSLILPETPLFATDKDQHLDTEELQSELNKIFASDKDQDLDTEELQSELNKLVADPPMFSGWNADNFDEDALPIPMFTATIVSLVSIAFTAYLFNIGINGFPDSTPPMV
jgi:hypothetical protein